MARPLDIQKKTPPPAPKPVDNETADDVAFYSDEPQSVKNPNSGIILNVILVLILLSLLVVAAYLYFRQTPAADNSPITEKTVREQLKSQPAASTTTVNETPTTTSAPAQPSPAESTGTPIVRVLNGSGREGAAGAIAAKLRAAGVAVASTGNARRFNYSVTTIYYDPGFKTKAEQIASIVKAGTVEEAPTVTGSADIIVVIGAK